VGDIGEIRVRGEPIVLGCRNTPNETAEIIRGDWLHAGDIGKVDEDGYLTTCAATASSGSRPRRRRSARRATNTINHSNALPLAQGVRFDL